MKRKMRDLFVPFFSVNSFMFSSLIRLIEIEKSNNNNDKNWKKRNNNYKNRNRMKIAWQTKKKLTAIWFSCNEKDPNAVATSKSIIIVTALINDFVFLIDIF